MRAVDAEQRGERVIITHQADEPWKIVGACDLAIAVGGGLSTSWAMAAGLPIAGQDHATVTALLTHEHNALLAPADSAGELARRIRQIIDEPDTASTIGRAAAEHARTKLHPGATRLAG
jgi:glycosyltransferase involved in cell wall biosynthesis